MHQPRTGGRARAVGIIISMSLMAAACAGEVTEEAAVGTTIVSEQAPEALALTTEPAAQLEDVSVTESVELIDSGAAPHVELRFDLDASSHTLEVSQTQTFDQAINGEDLGVASPQIINSTSTLDVTPDGETYSIESLIDTMVAGDATSPDIIEILNLALAQRVGTSSTTIIDNRGIVLRSSPQTEDEQLDDIARTIRNISSPLPVEPVGIGAVWERTQNLSLLGFDVEQVTRTTLTDIDGDIVTLTIEGNQNVPVGSTVETETDTIVVRSWNVDIAGTTVLDLGQVVPLESTSMTTTDQVLEINSAVIDQVLGLEVVVSGS